MLIQTKSQTNQANKFESKIKKEQTIQLNIY